VLDCFRYILELFDSFELSIVPVNEIAKNRLGVSDLADYLIVIDRNDLATHIINGLIVDSPS
jgi:hypothetical protein